MNEKSLIFSLFSKFLEDEKDDISPEESGTDKKESETEDGGTSKDGAGVHRAVEERRVRRAVEERGMRRAAKERRMRSTGKRDAAWRMTVMITG